MNDPENIIYVAIIDDDDSICRSLARLMRAADMQAVAYHSAEAFLRDKKQPRFDCLLLDVQLDGMSGLDLRKHLLATGSTVPVMFITAQDDPDAESRAHALGCSGYFRKTSLGSDILDTIRRITEHGGHSVTETHRPSGLTQ